MQESEKISKTQRKREMHELQALGERLATLSAEQIESIDLPEALRAAVGEARRITRHEARRRQMQYIGRLMRGVDPEPIREKLKIWDGVSAGHTAHVHLLERWRTRLLDEEGALGELVREHAGIDMQRLRSLIRSARGERDSGAPPRSYRELFRVLRELIPDPTSPKQTAENHEPE